jgi:phosphoserine phosphatase
MRALNMGIKRYLSGGFTYFVKVSTKELGIDYVHANELEIVDGVNR